VLDADELGKSVLIMKISVSRMFRGAEHFARFVFGNRSCPARKVYRARVVPMRKAMGRSHRLRQAPISQAKATVRAQAALAAGLTPVSPKALEISHADDANQAVIVDRQMTDVLKVHDVTNVLKRVGRGATTVAAPISVARLEIGARRVFSAIARTTSRLEHADGGVAFGAHDVLDHQRTDIAERINCAAMATVSFANRSDTGGLLRRTFRLAAATS
jgi:hypothetical protein